MNRNLQNVLLVCLLAVFSFILYFNSLWNGFVLDDQHTILDNTFIKEFRYWFLFLKGHYSSVSDIPQGMFRPLLLLTFSFNYFFSGIQPLGYHVINILIHFLNGVLLYLLFRILKKDLTFGLGLFFCLLFVTHPINTEAVTYISCRSDLLVTFFIAIAIISYARGRIFLSLFLYVCGLMTKETALTFGFLALSYDFIYGQENIHSGLRKRIPIFYSVLIGITMSYWFYRAAIFRFETMDLILPAAKSTLGGFWQNTFIQSAVSTLYLQLFFWPHPLNLHHEIPNYASLFHPAVFFSVLAITAMIILVFLLKKKYPPVSFGLAWYFICLTPKFYAPLNFPAMEHHFYLPGIGIYFILAATFEKFYLKARKYVIYLGGSIICLFMILTWARNSEWKNSVTLYRAAERDNPNSPVVCNNLGIQYADMGLSEEAERLFKKSLNLTNSVDVHLNCRINLAKIYLNRKQFKEAMDELDKALIIKYRYSPIYQSYGVIYKEMGQKEKAEEMWKKGLAFNPRATGIMDNIGILYLEMDKPQESKIYFQEAIKYSPDDAIAYFGLGQALERTSNDAEAIKAYEKSIFFDPASSLSHYCLGTLYAQKNDTRALFHLREAVRLKPDFAEGYNNLAVFYASLEPARLELAREYARKAISLGYKVDRDFLKIIGLPEPDD